MKRQARVPLEERIRRDASLNPQDLSAREFLDQWWKEHWGDNPSGQLAQRLGVDKQNIYNLRNKLGCAKVAGPQPNHKPGQKRANVPTAATHFARGRRLSEEEVRRRELVTQAKGGSKRARASLRKIGVRVYTRDEITEAVRSGAVTLEPPLTNRDA